jgi:hypothetical protein
MKNTLLGVIAVCLFMITLKLYIPEASAHVEDYDFESSVEEIVENCTVYGELDVTPHELWDGRIRC